MVELVGNNNNQRNSPPLIITHCLFLMLNANFSAYRQTSTTLLGSYK